MNPVLFNRISFPYLHIIRGIASIIALTYIICYLTFDFLFELPDIVLITVGVYSAVNIFEIFRRVVVNIEFNENTKQIHIEYLIWFFFRHKISVRYLSAGYLAYNKQNLLPLNLSFFKKIPLEKGLSHLHFYDGRKYIARIVVHPKEWESQQLEEMVTILTPFAREYKMSPGLL